MRAGLRRRKVAGRDANAVTGAWEPVRKARARGQCTPSGVARGGARNFRARKARPRVVALLSRVYVPDEGLYRWRPTPGARPTAIPGEALEKRDACKEARARYGTGGGHRSRRTVIRITYARPALFRAAIFPRRGGGTVRPWAARN